MLQYRNFNLNGHCDSLFSPSFIVPINDWLIWKLSDVFLFLFYFIFFIFYYNLFIYNTNIYTTYVTYDTIPYLQY